MCNHWADPDEIWHEYFEWVGDDFKIINLELHYFSYLPHFLFMRMLFFFVEFLQLIFFSFPVRTFALG